jgi:antitoxin (DNA-binding transcriptional repressor) of toxin-antitoxin stability system
MKTISIRELHAKTGRWVRDASKHGQILVTDNGRAIAKIVPESAPIRTPYFARRKYLDDRTRRVIERGRLGCGGADVTDLISEDREDRI